MSAEIIISEKTPLSPMHIASVVIHVRPEKLTAVKDWLATETAAEIHAESDQGKLVVVIEARNEQGILALLDGAHEQAGVLNAALVYHEILNEEHDAL